MDNSTEVDIVNDEEESRIAERWLHWCEHHEMIKCTSFKISQELLPAGYAGVLHDVKVGGKKRCPDDKIYSKYQDLRYKVARGNCILEINQLSELGITKTSYKFLVFALRKFSGGMGDEDEDDEACQNLWRNYFLKPVEVAEKVVVTSKANGEAGHLSSRQIGNETYFCLGSKNVHLIARNIDDLKHYKDSRFDTAVVVARSFFNTYLENPAIRDEQRAQLISYLQNNKSTAVMEVLQPNYQHIEDLSHLAFPELRFICWTSIYSDTDCDSLCSVPPNIAIDRAREFGLPTIEYEVIKASEAEDYMSQVRRESGYEGKVMYFMDENQNVFGIIKKKTAWYIILRALREKSCTFSSLKQSYSNIEMDKKLRKRLSEIQVWLGFSDTYRQTWEKLGIAFVHWLVTKARKSAAKSPAVRARFPQFWKEFLETHEEFEELYRNLKYS